MFTPSIAKVNTSTSGLGSDVACDAIEGCQTVSSNMTQSSSTNVDDQEVMAQLIYHFG